MTFMLWLLSIAMMATSGLIIRYIFKNIIWPYNKFVFEHTNECGVLVFQSWEENVAFMKYKAKNKFLGNTFSSPALIIGIPGMLIFVFITLDFIIG